MSWDTIIADPEFQALETDRKQKIANNYFAKNFESDKDFLSLPEEKRFKIKSNFESTLKLESALPSRGLFMDVATAPIRGLVNAAETYGRAARTLDPEGGIDIARKAGTGLVNLAERTREYVPSVFKPSKEAQSGVVRKAITEGVETFTHSLATGVPGGVVGAIGGIPGMIAGYATSGGALFGLAEYDQFLEEASKAINERKDLTPEEKTALIEKAKPLARKSALVEGGFEFASDLAEGLTMKIGKPFTQLAKGSVRSLLATTPKQVLLNMAKVAAIETPTEMTQAYLETGLRQKAGIDTGITPAQAGFEVIGPTLFSSVLFGALGSRFDYKQKQRIRNALVNPKIDIGEREEAVNAIAPILSKVNKPFADTWTLNALNSVAQRKPIDINLPFEKEQKQATGLKTEPQGSGLKIEQPAKAEIPKFESEPVIKVKGEGLKIEPVVEKPVEKKPIVSHEENIIVKGERPVTQEKPISKPITEELPKEKEIPVTLVPKEKPRGLIPTKEIWDKTPFDVQHEWDDVIDYLEEARKEYEANVKPLKTKLASLRGRGNKERKDELKKQIDELTTNYKSVGGEYEYKAYKSSEELRKEAIGKAKKLGLADEDTLDNFADEFLLESSPERPYIEVNYDKTTQQIFDEVLDRYLTTQKPKEVIASEETKGQEAKESLPLVPEQGTSPETKGLPAGEVAPVVSKEIIKQKEIFKKGESFTIKDNSGNALTIKIESEPRYTKGFVEPDYKISIDGKLQKSPMPQGILEKYKTVHIMPSGEVMPGVEHKEGIIKKEISKGIEGKSIYHFTKKENIEKILKEGFDTNLPPIHGTGALQKRDVYTKENKSGMGVLYFTTDTERWNKVQVYTGEGKGSRDYSYYDYDKQKWVTENKALSTINLSPLKAAIKQNANILVIDSMKKYLAFQKEYFGDAFPKDRMSEVINQAKDLGYDILNIKYKPKEWIFNEQDFYEETTGAGGKDDYFVFNKDVIDYALTKEEKPNVEIMRERQIQGSIAQGKEPQQVLVEEGSGREIKRGRGIQTYEKEEVKPETPTTPVSPIEAKIKKGTKEGESLTSRQELEEQMKEAGMSDEEIEANIQLLVDAPSKALGIPEDEFIAQVKRSTLAELEGQDVIYQESGLPVEIVAKIETSLINNTLDDTISINALRRYGKPHFVTISPSTPKQEAFTRLRRFLIDNPKGYDIVGGREILADKEYLEGKRNKVQSQDKRGAIQFDKDGKAIIYLLENADKSTFAHEMFHKYVEMMQRLPQLKPQLKILEMWIGKPVNKWSTVDHEKAAKSGEKYLWEGNAPTSGLKAVFEKFKKWLREIYKTAKSLDIKLSDDVRKMWDEWFGGKEGKQADIIPKMETEIQGQKKMFVNADVGGYAEQKQYATTERQPTELPEVVELYNEISEGKYPVIERYMKDKLGYYSPTKGKIGLRQDLPIGERLELTKHIAGFMDLLSTIPDLSLRKNDIVIERDTILVSPRIFKEVSPEFENYMRKESGLTEEEIVFKKDFNKKLRMYELRTYRRNKSLALQVLSHEVFHYIDMLPDKVKRGNILGHITSLKKYLKHMLDMFPTTEEEGINEIKIELRKQALRDAKGQEHFWKASNEIYKELLAKELATREVVTKQEIMAELKQLTQKIKPFDDKANPKFTLYRYSPKELYADAGGTLLWEPALLKETAPKFYESFLAYLERKPEVKETYDAIQNKLGMIPGLRRDVVIQDRIKRMGEGYKRGHEARKGMEERQKGTTETIFDTIMTNLIDEEHEDLKRIRKLEKQGGTEREIGRRARLSIEELVMIDSKIENLINHFTKEVDIPMKENNITLENLGVYAQASRVKEERGKLDIFNPGGETTESSKEMLEHLQRDWGIEKFNKVKELFEKYWELRKKYVFPALEEGKRYDPVLIEYVKNNMFYTRFSVNKYLLERFGGQITGTIYKQYGTLSEIENPIVATMLQDIMLIRASKINESKLDMVEVLRETKELTPAEIDKSTEHWKPKPPTDPKNYGIFTVMRDGKIEHYYVDRQIAESYQYDPYKAKKIAEVVRIVSQPFRMLLVTRNPVWMGRNIFRDIKGTIKNVPEMKLRNIPEFMIDYSRGLKESIQDVFGGKRSEDITKLMEGSGLVSGRYYAAKEDDYESKIQELQAEFVISNEEARQAPGAWNKLKRVVKLIDAQLDKAGRVSEMSTKVAGYKYLKKHSIKSEREIMHDVRTLIGTPNARRTGRLQWLTNNIFMFSNIGKEGLRSSWESIKTKPTAYIWKTTALNIIPLLTLLGAGAAGVEWIKKILAELSQYDIEGKTIIPTPYTINGKPVAIGIPEDYQGQIARKLVFRILKMDLKGILGTVEEMNPYQFHPLIKVGHDLYQYYVRSENPRDEFRNMDIIPPRQFRVGGWPASESLLKHSWNELGGKTFLNFSYDEIKEDHETIEGLKNIFPMNILGTYLIVSNQGIKQSSYKIQEKINKEYEKRNYAIRQEIVKNINSDQQLRSNRVILSDLYIPMVQNGMINYRDISPKEFLTKYKRLESKKIRNPYLNSLENANRNEVKEALLNDYLRKISKSEFRELFFDAVNSSIITREFARGYLVKYNREIQEVMK